jgi:hypothetical protein
VGGPFLSQLDPAYGKRLEFGELARQSGRLLNERSHAQIAGAENLLAKAVTCGAAGDLDRAAQLVQRAAAMPYDPREEGSPGVLGAAMLVHNLVSDQFETSEHGDEAWLDVVIDVHARLEGPGKAELASVVHGFVLQEVFYSVTPAEKRRIRQAFADAPLQADLGDGPDLTVERRRAIIGSLVAAAAALHEGYAGGVRAS